MLTLSLAVACAGTPAKPLTNLDREHVRKELTYRKLPEPKSLEVNDVGFVVADYELMPQEARRLNPRIFGQECLIAIREALLDKGYQDYRVNVNGPPPGTGLIQRYGSARFIGSGGKVEWLTP
jgi:hypothetical protein